MDGTFKSTSSSLISQYGKISSRSNILLHEKSIEYNDSYKCCKDYNKSGYFLEMYIHRWYILGLLMLVTKARNVTMKIGGNNHKINYTTGYTNSKGLFYGRYYTDQLPDVEGLKCFGIENMWGNLGVYIYGVIIDIYYQLHITKNWYNSDGRLVIPPSIFYRQENKYPAYLDAYDQVSSPKYSATNMTPIFDGAAMVPYVDQLQADASIGWMCRVIHSGSVCKSTLTNYASNQKRHSDAGTSRNGYSTSATTAVENNLNSAFNIYFFHIVVNSGISSGQSDVTCRLMSA